MIKVSAIARSACTCGRSCSAPNEQLRPIVSGLAWRTDVPEGLDRMARQVAAGEVGHSHRDHDRQVAAERRFGFLGGHDGGLGVQRVEHRLDQDEVGAAFEQRLDLLA